MAETRDKSTRASGKRLSVRGNNNLTLNKIMQEHPIHDLSQKPTVLRLLCIAREGEVEGDVVLVVTNDPEKLEL